MDDLREIAHDLREVETALGRIAATLQEALHRGAWVMVDEARDDVVESQARLIEALHQIPLTRG